MSQTTSSRTHSPDIESLEPDLPYHFIQDILLGMEELKAGQTEPYIFGRGYNNIYQFQLQNLTSLY